MITIQRKFTLFIFFLLCSLTLLGQKKRSTGLKFNDDAYKKVPLQPRFGGQKYDEIPLEISLKKYCPIPGSQGDMSSCVGWSTGYGLMTMCRAIQQNITDQKKITELSNSALYVYNQIIINPEDCVSGAQLTDGMELLKNEGDCLASSFDHTIQNCDVIPSGPTKSEAEYYKIADYTALFHPSDEPNLKLKKIKRSLADKKPVVIGMNITTSFFLIDEGEKVWLPEKEELEDETYSAGGHAMVVVGYDEFEKQFEILNSFGTEWGNKGFIKIDYDVFGQLCQYGFQAILQEKQGSKREIDVTSLTNLGGTFEFRLLGKSKDEIRFERDNTGEPKRDYFGNRILLHDVVPVKSTDINGVYTLGDDWEAGTLFHLATKDVPEKKYIYVFSIDSNNKVMSHFPKQTEDGKIPPMSTYIPNRNAEVIIPNRGSALRMNQGKDDLIVLFCNQEIEDYEKRLNIFRTTSGETTGRLKEGFEDILLSSKSIKYKKDMMSFSIIQNKKKENGYVVPLILTAEGK